VKLLLDHNLSRRLVPVLERDFPGTSALVSLGMDQAADDVGWKYAREHGFMIVSKDADFHQRSFVHGHPPKVVWVRIGNCTTDAIGRLLLDRAAELRIFAASEDAAFLALA
jgi:predicted nuclease of predicted toxin-antitoxin system